LMLISLLTLRTPVMPRATLIVRSICPGFVGESGAQ
jgi:hypothetical protein